MILEKQAKLEEKRKLISLEQAIVNGQSSPGKGSPNSKMPRSLIEPVNKVTPQDGEKTEACLDLVKRLRLEKKARQKKLDEI